MRSTPEARRGYTPDPDVPRLASDETPSLPTDWSRRESPARHRTAVPARQSRASWPFNNISVHTRKRVTPIHPRADRDLDHHGRPATGLGLMPIPRIPDLRAD